MEKSTGGIRDVPSALTRVAPREVGAVTRAGAPNRNPANGLGRGHVANPETVAKDVEADMCVRTCERGRIGCGDDDETKSASALREVRARESAPGPTRNIPGCRAGRSTTPSSCPANVTAQSALREPRIDGSKRTN